MARKKKHKGSGNAQEVQNAAKTLFANIRFQSVDNPIRSVLVTSTVPNEGKTTVALSLAIAAGRSGNKVLLMEGDMRRRSMRAVIDARPRYGLHALLTKRCSLEAALTETGFDNVWFIDAEAGIPNPDGLLNSRMLADLIEQLVGQFDYIIADTPPVTAPVPRS